MLLLLVLSLSSCKKWLDLQPETEIAKDELFKTQEGFQEAINGIYTHCTDGALYGNELSFGFLDVMAQNYSFESYNDGWNYIPTSQFKYKNEYFIERSDRVWAGLYKGIVNANLILENIDKDKTIFTDNNYGVIKGEALALRAYLHFDLFRMYGSYAAASKTGIPYVSTYSNKVTALSSADEVMNNVLTDLEAAKALLRTSDSILSPGYLVNYPLVRDSSTERSARSLFHQNRRHRLNYYAVCGELARAYLYKGDKPNALLNAEEVIRSNKFAWTSQTQFLHVDNKEIDRIGYKELIFAWQINKRKDEVTTRFEGSSGKFNILEDPLKFIYESGGSGSVGGEDLRLKQWFQPIGDKRYNLIKYMRNPNARDEDSTGNKHPLMAPAIRLSEMHYIAAEAIYESNPAKALEYLTKVRNVRGIGTPLQVSSYEQMIQELLKDARKEWFGEGQLFYMYKRLNRGIVGQVGSLTPPSKEVFILPLPNNEIEFGGR